MKFKFYFFLLTFIGTFAIHAQTLDQSNTTISSTGVGAQIGQSFTAGLTGELAQFNFYNLVNSGVTYPVNCKLNIYEGAGNTGTLLGSQDFVLTDTDAGEFEIVILTTIDITADNVYTAYIVPEDGETYIGFESSDGVDGYTSGSIYSDNATASADILFKTFVVAPATHLNFDGVDDYVLMNVGASNMEQKNYTHELWFRTSNLNGTLFNIAGDPLPFSGSFNETLYLENGYIKSYVYDGGVYVIESISTYNDNEWHHVSEIVTDTERSLYVDDVLIGTDTHFSAQDLDYVVLGASYRLPGYYFEGDIDEVRIWNEALSTDDISRRQYCELQGDEIGLLAYYNFNEGVYDEDNTTITTLTDATTNGFDGTLTNFALTGTTSNWVSGSQVVTGSLIPSVATVITPVNYAVGDTASELTATTGGTGLIWYTTETEGTGDFNAPTPSTDTLGSTSYWVASTNDNGCESERVEIVVTVSKPATHLNFDGVDDYVQIEKPFTSDFTIEYMVKTSISGNTGSQWFEGKSIVDAEIANVTTDFGTTLVGNRLAFGIGYPDVTIFSTSDINDGNWNHVAVTWVQATGEMNLYINGVKESTGTGSTSLRSASDYIKLGTNNNNGNYFNGNLDELRIWNVARTEAEISNSKDCELTGTETGLVSYYQFNQGIDSQDNSSLTTLIDATSNANNGTLTNFALTGTASNWLAGSSIITGVTCVTLSINDNTLSESDFKLYPNPVQESIYLDVKELTNVSVQVIDLNGRQIFSKRLINSNETLNMSNFESGMYLIKIKSSEGEIIKKIIKK